MQKKHMQFRQGDVLIVRSTRKLPKKATEIPMSKMGPILALGEVTGHHHTVVAQPETYNPKQDLPATPLDDFPGLTVADYAAEQLAKANAANKTMKKVNSGTPACRLYSLDGGGRMLVVERHTILRHEEHPAIELEPDNYEIIQQEEFTPEGWRAVQD